MATLRDEAQITNSDFCPAGEEGKRLVHPISKVLLHHLIVYSSRGIDLRVLDYKKDKIVVQQARSEEE